MRVVLADLKSNRGFVSKDTVVGGYGSRLDPFSRVTRAAAYVKEQFHDVPRVHMAYVAAIPARAGHEVKWTREATVDGDVALVLSSLVDYKNETKWADEMRAKGVKVGDSILVGEAKLVVRGVIADEPDRLAVGFALGPRLMIAKAALDRSALVQPGSNGLLIHAPGKVIQFPAHVLVGQAEEFTHRPRADLAHGLEQPLHNRPEQFVGL